MRAITYDRYGPPEVLRLQEVATPEPGPHDVVVAVGATTATSACGMMRRGDTVLARLLIGLFRPRRRYRVMGIELGGTVARVGREVTRFRPGDRVFGFTGFAAGAYAEYVRLPERASLLPAPPGLTHAEAAALVDGATTAHYFLCDRARVKAGERVAIVGASGAVGTAAVQLARHLGAEVTAVTSGKNAELVRSLGADRVVDYTVADYSAEPDRYDVVFDTVGKSSFAAARRCLAPGGRYLVTTGGPLRYLRDLWSRLFGRRRFIFGMSIDKRRALAVVADLARAGALRPVIDRTYPLDAIVEAHRYVDSGRKRGNVIITVGATG